MRRYPEHLVRQARRLSVGGELSYVEIARKLGVANDLVSIWCRDLKSSRFKGLVAYNQLRREVLLDSEKSFVDIPGISYKLFCALLYGCEGAKYPATVGVRFTNSDPLLVKSFVILFRKSFVLNEDKWRVQLQIHNDQNHEKLVDFWGELLGMSGGSFIKPTITSPRGKKHRNEYFGTCTVRYYDFRLQLKLIGLFNEFLRKSTLLGG